jgi:hypothetical protein
MNNILNTGPKDKPSDKQPNRKLKSLFGLIGVGALLSLPMVLKTLDLNSEGQASKFRTNNLQGRPINSQKLIDATRYLCPQDIQSSIANTLNNGCFDKLFEGSKSVQKFDYPELIILTDVCLDKNPPNLDSLKKLDFKNKLNAFKALALVKNAPYNTDQLPECQLDPRFRLPL